MFFNSHHVQSCIMCETRKDRGKTRNRLRNTSSNSHIVINDRGRGEAKGMEYKLRLWDAWTHEKVL